MREPREISERATRESYERDRVRESGLGSSILDINKFEICK